MRTVLVSGARRGIGAAIAARLLGEGHNVSIGLRGGEHPDWAGDASLRPYVERLHLVDYDALDRNAATRWVGEARERFGSIDTIVANAGIMIARSVIEANDDDVQAMFDVNVQAPRRLAKAAWDQLAECGQGRVIILSSLSGKRVKSAKAGSYALTKFAATALAHAIRHAGFDLGIRATAVCPGFVATDMALGVSDRPPELMTDPRDLARIVSLLISLPNEASVAEFAVNCQIEESF
ncbi:SDR family NAD(P)-dependent oxidoreductase [Aliihoeflea aestuarii]|uniref:SDR family NAD(P)-dependent oxidoreductase n=1 Tax=Aliihoeflea aestuarii TaxID=453840 RepID=UPI00209372CD|nr:SDR family NAD(P)-dependent oxidoreductase [Aliihoeflea aestuarii]MCO6389586.1 SDR family NAD(P)-dependent oxidoreductase [Aliihoeflea aestuarii]